MTEVAVPFAVTLCVCLPSWLAYSLGSRWLAAREQVKGMATKADVAEVRKVAETACLAVSNLAKETDEKCAELRSQQVGVIAGMNAQRGNFRR